MSATLPSIDQTISDKQMYRRAYGTRIQPEASKSLDGSGTHSIHGSVNGDYFTAGTDDDTLARTLAQTLEDYRNTDCSTSSFFLGNDQPMYDDGDHHEEALSEEPPAHNCTSTCIPKVNRLEAYV